MPTISVDVDVELDEFNSEDLIDELRDRIKYSRISESEKQKLQQLASKDPGFKTSTLRDQMKYDHLIEVFDQYSLEEIQELLPNKILIAI